MSEPNRSSIAGAAYLDLRVKARQAQRPMNEYLVLYALEGFLARLSGSPEEDIFVLKGGVLLAAYGSRRPTRDIDVQASGLDNDTDTVRAAVCRIAARTAPDGLVYDIKSARAETIRDGDAYSGVRVSMDCHLATANMRLQVDVNVGDPLWPEPERVDYPKLLGGQISVRGYRVELALAEKIVTAMQRGTANTRWRDFADIVTLSRTQLVDAAMLRESIERVAAFRGASIIPLATVLEGYDAIGQAGWSRWRVKQQLEDQLPEKFADLLAEVTRFTDPLLIDDNVVVWNLTSDRWQTAASGARDDNESLDDSPST